MVAALCVPVGVAAEADGVIREDGPSAAAVSEPAIGVPAISAFVRLIAASSI